MSQASGFTGLVLAGGKSTRMGRDKASLTYQGKSWLEQAVSLLHEAGAQHILVNTHIKTHYENVHEPYPNKGPLSGIYAGLLATDQPVLVLPVDMPTIGLAPLNVLLASKHESDCIYFETSPLPCYLRNTEEQKNQLKARLTSPNTSLSLYSAWRNLEGFSIETDFVLQSFNQVDDIK